jgi:pilus assembly protein TadC
MTRPRWRPAGLSVLCGLVVGIVVGGPPGFVVGAVAAVGSYRWLAGRPSAEQVALARAVAADLPFAADLLASALRAGAPPDAAAGCAGRALGGPLGARLERVERSLRLGSPADEAWAYLLDAGGRDTAATLAAGRLVQAAVRSQHSGAALAGSLLRVADDLRGDRLIDADADGRRAGVLIVLPLGLCFLPAFVLAGLVPVIVAVLGGVLNHP